MSDWIGRTLSKVRIEELLGKGGMAEVYRGQHTTLKREVAVKVIHSHLAEDETLLTRFSDEAQQVATLRHPNIVQVLDYDVADDNSPYMVMEFIEGLPLNDYLKEQHKAGKTLPYEMIAHLVEGVASALDYAHRRGIVHRDIKPANVMLRPETGFVALDKPLPDDVQPILTDFGVARMQNVTAARTQTGALIGTPTYMSPEQVQGDPVDARTDIYALGVMLYEMLAGTPPFDPGTDTPATILFKQVLEEPPPLEDVSPEVRAVVEKAMAKDPDDRFNTAGEMAAAFKSAIGEGTGEAAPAISPKGEIEELPTALTTSTQPMKVPGVAKKGEHEKRSGGSIMGIVGAVIVVGVIVALLAITGVIGGGEGAAPESEETAEEVVEEEEAAEPAPTEEQEAAGDAITVENAGDVAELSQFAAAPEGSYAMALSPDGEHVAVFGFDGSIRIYETESQNEVRVLEGGHSGPGYGLAYTPDGSEIVSGGEDFRLIVWDVANGSQTFNEVADTNPVDIEITPDGQTMVFVGSNSSSVFMHRVGGSETGRISEHAVVLGSVAVSPDGSLIASGNSRGNVVISELDSLETVTTLNDGSGTLWTTTFSPDGEWLAAGSGSGDIWIWDTSSWELSHTWLAHSGGVRSLAWSPDSRLLVSGGSGGGVTLWDAADGSELSAFDLAGGANWNVEFSSDGSFFTVLSDLEGTVHTFGLQ